MLNWIRKRLGKPLIGRDRLGRRYAYVASAPKDSPIQWRITTDRKLLFRGDDLTPFHPITIDHFRRILARMREKISRSSRPIGIDGISIEEHVATSLWNEGVITQSHLENAEIDGEGIAFTLRIDDADIRFTIQEMTYYESYDVIVSNHPNGLVRVRDLPDTLTMIASRYDSRHVEPIF